MRHGYVTHDDPFWPRYWRSLTGRSPCPLVPPATPTIRPAIPEEVITPDMF
jgi:hypothetical protein